MTDVASRELRNNTRDVLRRAEAGEKIVITVDGRAVAELRAIEDRPTWISREKFVRLVLPHQADAGLTDVLEQLAGGETTDDMGTI